VSLVQSYLDQYGVAVIENAVDADLVQTMRQDLLLTKRHDVFIAKGGKYRQHYILDPFYDVNTSNILAALGVQEMYDRNGSGKPSVSGYLSQLIPAGSSLTELAAILTYPQAEGQTMHVDTKRTSNSVRMVSAFLALQNITDSMGPLEVQIGSHVQPNSTSTEALVPAGAIVLMDSHVLHRGSAHMGSISQLESMENSHTRVVFYVTWTEPPSIDKNIIPNGSTFALAAELWGRTAVPIAAFHKATCGTFDAQLTWTIFGYIESQMQKCPIIDDFLSASQYIEYIKCFWKTGILDVIFNLIFGRMKDFISDVKWWSNCH
jgi:hypothetical protein